MSSWAIVTVAWRSAADLERLVASMNEHLAGEGAPALVVVDNEPDPTTQEAAQAWTRDLTYLPSPGNPGFGSAANRGVEAATAETVVLLNPDTELLDASLAELARFALERHALAGPRVLGDDRSLQPSASGPPTGPWPWLGAVTPGRLQPRALRLRTEPWRLERTVRVSWLSGACVAAPRRLLLDLGPFDPAIHLYGEDMDLGLRAQRAGVPSYFCPEVARVVHHGRGSTSQLLPEGPWELMARNRRAVLRRAFGDRRERASQAALLLNLWLRVASKRLLRQDATRDRAALRAALDAREVPGLPPPPSPSATKEPMPPDHNAPSSA